MSAPVAARTPMVKRSVRRSGNVADADGTAPDVSPDELLTGANVERPGNTRIVLHAPDAHKLVVILPPRRWVPEAFVLALRASLVAVFVLVWTLFWVPLLGRGFPAAVVGALMLLLAAYFWWIIAGMMAEARAALHASFERTYVLVERHRVVVRRRLGVRDRLSEHAPAGSPRAVLDPREDEVCLLPITITGLDAPAVFGHALRDEEKRWLVGELNRFFARLG